MFQRCDFITSVVMPDSVTTIGEFAFGKCRNLANIIFSKGIKTICEGAFLACAVEFVSFPEGILDIGKSSFAGCKNLKEVVIPDGVINIGEWAFNCCDNFKKITFLGGVTNMNGSFSHVEIVNIMDLSKWCNMNFSGSDSNPISTAGKFYMNGKLVTHLEIPEGVTEIKRLAFCDCNALRHVTIPESVNKIGVLAFGFSKSIESFTFKGYDIDFCGENNPFSTCGRKYKLICRRGSTIDNFAKKRKKPVEYLD